MAAGLTLRPSIVPEFRAFLCKGLAGETNAAGRADAIDIDGLVSPGDGARAAFDEFGILAPHGSGNPEPTFALADVRPENAMALRGGHVRCVLADATGARIGAVAWRSSDTPIGQRLLGGGGGVHAVGKLRLDTWRGKGRIELELEDIADPRQA
jgi:single-stranded-DNA-specific exonuclease